MQEHGRDERAGRVRADRIARQDREAAVRECRNVFELGVLARLIEICGLSPPGAA